MGTTKWKKKDNIKIKKEKTKESFKQKMKNKVLQSYQVYQL